MNDPHSSDTPEMAAEPQCEVCEALWTHGRAGKDSPIHCRRCHKSWTGNEAQHCVKCCHTFTGITAADAHRFRKLPSGATEDRCIDPAVTEGWREKRPGVWTNAEAWAGPEVK